MHPTASYTSYRIFANVGHVGRLMHTVPTTKNIQTSRVRPCVGRVGQKYINFIKIKKNKKYTPIYFLNILNLIKTYAHERNLSDKD